MKKALLIATIVAAMSCKSKKTDQHLPQIEKSIKENAMGIDIGYEPGKLDTVAVVPANTSIRDLEKDLNAKVSTDWNKAIKVYTGVYEDARKENDVNAFNLWKWEVSRMQLLRKLKPTDVDYSVYKYTYHVKNILNPKGDKNEVVNCYFFNHADSLIGHLDYTELTDLKRNYIKSDTQPYHIAMMKMQTGIN